jgi:hypothetical protein
VASTLVRGAGYRQPADSSRRKPFIVDAPATMLKRNAGISRNARNLYGTLRALADGKTGELRIGGRWLKATAFDRAAEMGRNTRLPAMRELVAAGLVTAKRTRVWQKMDGRMRAVAGPTEYTVHREPAPKIHQKTRHSSKVHLQKSIFSTVQEMDPQVLSNPPVRGAGLVSPDSELCSSPLVGTNHHQHPAASRTGDDDDSRTFQSNFKGNGNGKPNNNPAVEEKQTHVEKVLDRAAERLKKRGEDSVFVAEALAFIDQRSHEARTVPASERYYLTAYQNLLDAPDDLAAVTDSMIRKSSLRAKYMPEPIIPNKKDEKKIRFVGQIVNEADRGGRPAREVLRERLASDAGASARNRKR